MMFRFKKRLPSDILIFVVALSCTALIAGCRAERPMKIGESAPEISALDLNDKAVKLSDFRGKVVVLRFWLSACRACVAEMPVLDEFSKRYKERGLVVLAINGGDSWERIEKFIGDMKISYPVLLDQVLITSKRYGVSGVPTTFLIDRNGIARKVFVGETTQESFEKTVLSLL